jgi:L-threonylcarbamoyladenylate synthase
MDFQQDIDHCLQTLREGGLILYPTDTVWGIGCDATSDQAVRKIFELKKRPSGKSMILLMTDAKEVMRYITHADLRVFEYLEKAEKPTTVIYEGVVGIADSLIDEDGTVAIRIVRDPFCRQLLKRFRKPIVSTSANFSAESTPGIFTEIAPEILALVDYVVKWRQDDLHPRQSSTIIRMNKDGTVTTLRS